MDSLEIIGVWSDIFTNPKNTITKYGKLCKLEDSVKASLILGAILGISLGMLTLFIRGFNSPEIPTIGITKSNPLFYLLFSMVFMSVVFGLILLLFSIIEFGTARFFSGKGEFQNQYFLDIAIAAPFMTLYLIFGIFGAIIAITYGTYIRFQMLKEIHQFDTVENILTIIVSAMLFGGLRYLLGGY